ncbi:unnamed protein product [Orchesella dallaii]|uniref:EF-hand domain-containing protein n=1 Tax=Orchesella dallaii TaxID=48710 RepID=A0ABP1PQR6_9HEXA
MAFQLPGMPGVVDPQVMAWFNAVDQDRSGRINAQELQTALQSGNGRRFSDSACRLMISMFDGGVGSIDLNGFAELYKFVNQWIDTFKRLDADGSGFIDRSELAQAMKLMGYNFPVTFTDLLVMKFGRQRPGYGLAVDEFIMACILIHNLTASFRLKDPYSQGTITIRHEELLTMCLNTLSMTT